MSVVNALAGGALIGAGAAVLVLFNEKIAGISGIAGSLIARQPGEGWWRITFLVGLMLPALLVGLGPVAFSGGLPWLAAAGLLVGVGTRVGSGCTSGHGVCGLARGSRRSLAATAIFMGSAMLTVFVVHHVVQP